MAQDEEFFRGLELIEYKSALALIIGDLQTASARGQTFSKQRMRRRLESIRKELSDVIGTLPEG